MAHLGANGSALFPSAAGETQVDEEVLENAEESDEGFPELLQEQLRTEQVEEDESADEGILDILNTTIVSKTSPPAFQENRAHRRGISMTKAITGLFSGGLRLLGAGTTHQPTGNNYTENIYPPETTDNRIDHPAVTSSASKTSQKLVRPSILYQPLDKYNANSGKPDPYEINASPEKADVEPAKETRGLKRKRKEPVTKKQPSTRTRSSTSKTVVTAAEKSEEELNDGLTVISTTGQLPVIKRVTRATRSHASVVIIEPSDFSKRPENLTYQSIRATDGSTDLPRKLTGQPKKDSKPAKGTRYEVENGDRRSPNEVYDTVDESPANSIRKSKRLRDLHYEDDLDELGDDELQLGLVSDISAEKTGEAEVSIGAGVNDKESYGGEDEEDGGYDDEGGHGEEQPATVTVDEGISAVLLDPTPKKLQPQVIFSDALSDDSEDSEDGGYDDDENGHGEEQPATVTMNEGISAILLDPTPKKLQPQVLTADASSDDPEDSEDEDSEDGDNDDEDGNREEQAVLGASNNEDASHTVENLNNSRDRGQLPSESSDFGKNFVTKSKIREMVGHVEKIGRDKNGRLQIRKDDLESYSTEQGGQIGELIKRIIADYKAIQEQKANDGPDDATEKLLSSVARKLDKLEGKMRSIVKKRLGDPEAVADGDKKKHAKLRQIALEDLYMRIMPELVHALHAAIVAYGEKGPPSTSNIQEILRYKILFTYLLDIAENSHNRRHRPGLETNHKYPVLKPYRSLNPLLRNFHQLCMGELKSREQRAEAKRLAPELAKKRKEQAEAARLEKKAFRLKRQRQAECQATFNQMRVKLMERPLSYQSPRNEQYSQLSQPTNAQKRGVSNTMNRQGADIAGIEDFDTISTDGEFPASGRQTQGLTITERRKRAEREANALALKLKEAETLAKKLRREEQRLLQAKGNEDDEEAEIERVEMFPTGNNHATAARPWTQTECEMLADGLRLESGLDRYANIALRLDRSLDEIFEKARDFRRIMIEKYYQKHQLPVEPWVESIGRDD